MITESRQDGSGLSAGRKGSHYFIDEVRDVRCRCLVVVHPQTEPV